MNGKQIIMDMQANGNERYCFPKQTKVAKGWRNHCKFSIYTERYSVRNSNVVLHTILGNTRIRKEFPGQTPPC